MSVGTRNVMKPCSESYPVCDICKEEIDSSEAYVVLNTANPPLKQEVQPKGHLCVLNPEWSKGQLDYDVHGDCLIRLLAKASKGKRKLIGRYFGKDVYA